MRGRFVGGIAALVLLGATAPISAVAGFGSTGALLLLTTAPAAAQSPAPAVAQNPAPAATPTPVFMPGPIYDQHDAWCYNSQATNDQVVRGCTAVIEQARRTAPQDIANAYYSRGVRLNRLGQYDRALLDFDQAIKLAPTDAAAFHMRGQAWWAKGNDDRAFLDFDRAIALDPKQFSPWADRAAIYMKRGERERGLQDYMQAVRLKPDDPTINDHLGDAYWKVGRVLEAKFQWAHARDLKPEPDELAKINQKLQDGLKDEAASNAADADKTKKPGNGG